MNKVISGPGRPALQPGTASERVTITLTPEQVEAARQFGGTVSNGIRLALEALTAAHEYDKRKPL